MDNRINEIRRTIRALRVSMLEAEEQNVDQTPAHTEPVEITPVSHTGKDGV